MGKCRALLWGTFLRFTVLQVSDLYCGACVRALLWGKCPRSTLGQVYAL
jgi:hypothetical protein